jgi:chorismate dehydratase
MEIPIAPHRIGAVPYLNATPLIAQLPSDIQKTSPQYLSHLFLNGLLDVALVPSIIALDRPDLYWIPGICISSHGQVLSVILQHRVPISQIKSIAVDNESRTSVTLTEIIFRLFYNQKIILLPESHPDADAQLWIGDRALTLRQNHPHFPILDLGEIWTQHTNLPFVYAAWAIHPQLPSSLKTSLTKIIQHAAHIGLNQRDQFATTAFEHEYLHRYIQYDLDSKAIEGWLRFLHYAASLHNFSAPATLNFV